MATLPQSFRNWFSRSKSLSEDLAEVCDSVVNIKKLGFNEDGQYDYLRIVDMCEAFKGELFQRGIFFMPSDIEAHVDYWTNEAGERVADATVKTEFIISRGRQQLKFCSYGVGRDTDGKAMFIAQTGAFKALLKRITMVYGEADEPDSARQTGNPRQIVREAAYQRRAWQAAVRDSGLPVEKISEELSAIMEFPIDANDIPSLPRENFNVAMKWLLSHQDLSGQWAKSVEAVHERKRGPQPVVRQIDQEMTDEVAGD